MSISSGFNTLERHAVAAWCRNFSNLARRSNISYVGAAYTQGVTSLASGLVMSTSPYWMDVAPVAGLVIALAAMIVAMFVTAKPQRSVAVYIDEYHAALIEAKASGNDQRKVRQIQHRWRLLRPSLASTLHTRTSDGRVEQQVRELTDALHEVSQQGPSVGAPASHLVFAGRKVRSRARTLRKGARHQ